MSKLEKFIGDVIYISFRQLDRFKDIGISRNGHYKLKGYDQLGLWLEHPGILIKRTEDTKGSPISFNEQVEELVQADFMVHWDNINSILHYPDRVGFDFDDDKTEIGFKVINNE